MKKLLLKMGGVIIFVGLFYFVGLLCLGFFAPPIFRKNLIFPIGGYGHLNSRMQDVKNVNNVDILFLGSSHAYREFDTRIFEAQGYKSFNLGSSGQTPLQTVVLLKRYLHSLHPKLVVYEVYPATFTFDGVEAAIDLIANDRVGWDTYKMAFSLNDILTYNTLLYASLCQLLGVYQNFEEAQNVSDDYYVRGGGYVEKKLSRFENRKHPVEKWNLDAGQLKAFDSVIRLLKQEKCNFVLVQAPVTRSLYHAKTNNSEIDTFFSTYGRYFNFNEVALPLDDSLHFYDSDHLNQEGVVIFNTAFIQAIKF